MTSTVSSPDANPVDFLAVAAAAYEGGRKVEITFSTQEHRLVDLGPFLQTQYNRYKDPDLFQHFKIENGNLVWGDDWDLIFPVSDFYQGTIH